MLLGEYNLHKVPQITICKIVGPGHLHPSISGDTIFNVKPTCSQYIAYVETWIIRISVIETFDDEDV